MSNRLFAIVLDKDKVNIVDVSNNSIVHQIYPPLSSGGSIISVNGDNRAEYISVVVKNNSGDTPTYIYKKCGRNSWMMDRYFV